MAFRDEFCTQSVRGCIKALGGDCGKVMPDNCVFVMLDGHVHGLESKLTGKPFCDDTNKPLPKEKKLLFITKTETSVRASKNRIKGTMSVNTVEFAHIVSKEPIEGDEKPRLHFPHLTDRSDSVGPFEIPCMATVGTLVVKHSDKPKLYGSKAFRECGGRIEDDPGAKVSKSPVSDDDVPMSWHMNSKKLWEELSVAYNVVGWINITETDGNLAMHCIESDRPYLSLCHTNEFRDLIEQHIQNCIFADMQDASSSLHEPALVTLLAEKKKQSSGSVDPKPGVLPKAKAGKPKSKAKEKPDGQKKKKKKPNALGEPNARDDLLNRLRELDDAKDDDSEGSNGSGDDDDAGSDAE